MALRPCRECGAQVSTEADTCPHCGIAQPANADSLINVRPGRDPINYPQKKRKRWGLWLGVAIFLFWLVGGFIWLLNMMGVDTDTMLSYSIPKCDSKTTLNLAKQAIEGSPMAKMINITAYEFHDVEEIDYDPNLQKRRCRATALLNSGKHDLQFSLEWANQKEGTVWLQIENID